MNMISRICPQCQEPFNLPYKFRNRQTCCSISCGLTYTYKQRKLPNSECGQCGATLYVAPARMSRSKSGVLFCNRVCKGIAQRIGGVAAIMPHHYGDGLSDYRARGLREHGAKCIQCGFCEDVRMLDVDHIDSNRTNRTTENLQVLCVWCHALKTRKVPRVEPTPMLSH